MFRRLFAACLIAASALAAPASAAPQADTSLQRVFAAEGRVTFIAMGSLLRDGDNAHIWTFVAEPQPMQVEKDLVIGEWVDQAFNCAAHTGAMSAIAAVDDHFAIAFTQEEHDALEAMNPNTPLAIVYDYACSGSKPTAAPVAGIRAAIEARKAG
jgi:hypothetical protein